VSVDVAIDRYHALLQDVYGDAMQAHLAQAVAANRAVDECRVLRPYFIEASRYAQTLDVVSVLNAAVVTAAQRLRDDTALRRTLGIPVYLDEIIEIDRAHGRPSVMARIDGLFDPAGAYQMIEYNAQPEFGAARAIDETFANAPIAAELARLYAFRTQRLNDYAVDAIRAATPGSATPTIGVPQGNDRARDWLRDAPARGCRVSFAPYERYRVHGSRLVVDEETGPVAIDTVALPWRDVAAPTPAMAPILEALRLGQVHTLDGLSLGLLCSYKHTLELLSDPVHAGMFGTTVAATLARHVPWTRVVRQRSTTYAGQTIDLASFIAGHRERLVLKPSGGARGEGVMIGRLCDDATWTKTLTRALKQPYIVQEHVQGSTARYPRSEGTRSLVTATSDFNPFVWNANLVRGCQVRLSTTGKHSPDEAWVTAVWVFEDEHAASPP
jgi:hypothetical protein